MSYSDTDGTTENTPAFTDHGCGIWSISYYWRDAAEALVQFRKCQPKLRITAMIHTQFAKSSGKITLVTETVDAGINWY
jgi:hypothetical protein